MAIQDKPLGEFIKAVSFAAEKHRRQCRKDANAMSYIITPLFPRTTLNFELKSAL